MTLRHGLMEHMEGSTRKIIYGWLLLALFSLVFAGVFALLVAFARTPVIEDMLPLGKDYIYVALVGHVVLAVVIWFLAFEGFLWAYTSSVYMGRPVFSPVLGWTSLSLSSSGVALVVVSSVFALGQPELANYVPVLLTPVFYSGLVLFSSGIFLNLVNTFFTLMEARASGAGKLPTVTVGMAASGFAVFIAFVCFAFSGYFQLSTGKAYLDFERLFWGGGHILQFANTMAMVTVWFYLARITSGKEPLGGGPARALYGLYLLFILPAPFIYFIYDTSAQAYKDSFTALMQWGLGPSTALFMLAVIALIVRGGKAPLGRPGFSSLILSMAIFSIGGVIAVMIRGVNTIIPAHYHSVIGAVTIAFMGLFYELMPVFKRDIWSPRLSRVQPYLYFSGILLFSAGLFIAGSHGVARKTYGEAQNLNNVWKLLGMSVMGIGGIVSIAGGITFVINALATMLKREDPSLEDLSTGMEGRSG